MNCQELKDQGSAPVEIVFSENRLICHSFVGGGVLLSIIRAFNSGKKPRTQSDRIRGI